MSASGVVIVPAPEDLMLADEKPVLAYRRDGAADKARGGGGKLPHLTGVRTLVAMWIVCHHMAPQKPSSSISVFTMRVDVAVEMFMILSGFMTHYAYGDKDFLASAGSLLSFYARRLARVCLTAQLGMVMCIFWYWFGHAPLFTATNLSCFFFLKPWYSPEPDCPDSPAWFVAALIPSWLVYPIVTRRVLAAHPFESPRALLLLCGVLWLAALGPPLVLIALQGAWLTWNQVKYTWFWPPAQLADFAFGSALAALAKRAPPRPSAGRLADVAAVVLLFAVLVCPIAEMPANWTGPNFRPGHYLAWDALSGRAAAPALAVWIYCSSGVGGGSASGRFLSHTLLVSAGAYTLEVYIFQTPLHSFFIWTEKTFWLPQLSTEVFILYLWALWIISVLFVEKLANPADKWLRDVTAQWEGQPFSYFLGRHQFLEDFGESDGFLPGDEGA